ncbi:MAG: nucleotidyltransferase [Candidatus Micrarchaeota archaeon]
MEIGIESLTEFVLQFDKYLPRRMKIVAIGGTALTLLGKKASTKDVDFCFLNEQDKAVFVRVAEKLGYKPQLSNRLIGRGVTIDLYASGYIFCVQLPADYAKKSIKLKEMQKIELFALDPLDLLITKAARFNARDKEDIITIIHSYNIDQKLLVDRWIKTMENSMVRDAKEHLRVLLLVFEEHGKADKQALKKAEGWING